MVFLTPPRSTPILPLSQLHALDFVHFLAPLFLMHWFDLCCPLTCECGTSHWSMISLPGAVHLKETNSSSPRRHRLPIVHKPHPHATMQTGLVFCRQPQRLWVPQCSSSHVQKNSHLGPPWTLALTDFISSSMMVLSLVEWFRCPICWTLQWYLFSERWWWVSVLTTIYHTKTLLWWGLRAALTYGTEIWI